MFHKAAEPSARNRDMRESERQENIEEREERWLQVS
jgi:hypothetical protein